jgi:hypothetical protein
MVREHHTVDSQTRINAANKRQSQQDKGEDGPGARGVAKRSSIPTRQHKPKQALRS